MRRCCSVASTPLHLVKEITLQCWLFYLDPIIIFLSDKSRPNRVRAEGSGANWGMRCGDRALHLGLCDRGTRAGCWAASPTRRLQMRRVHIPPARSATACVKHARGFFWLFFFTKLKIYTSRQEALEFYGWIHVLSTGNTVFYIKRHQWFTSCI